MIAHIYPSVLQALAGRGYAGCLDGCFQGCRGEAMQDPACELPRITILGTWVNKPHGPTAEGRREIAILMSFPPPLISGSIFADRKPVAAAFAIRSYATAWASSFLMIKLLTRVMLAGALMSGCGSSCVKPQTSIPPFGAFTLGQSILAGSAVSGLTAFANMGLA